MSATSAQSSALAAAANGGAEERAGGSRAPLCFVVDADASIRHFVSLILHGSGIDTEEFADGQAVHAALAHRVPSLVFLNVALESTDAIQCIMALAHSGYAGRRTF